MYTCTVLTPETVTTLTSLPWELSSSGDSVSLCSRGLEPAARNLLGSLVRSGDATCKKDWRDENEGTYTVSRPTFQDQSADDVWSAIGAPRVAALENAILPAIGGLPLHRKVGGLGGIRIRGSFFVLSDDLSVSQAERLRAIAANNRNAAISEATRRDIPARFEFGNYDSNYREEKALVETLAQQEFDRLQQAAARYLDQFCWRLEKRGNYTVLVADSYQADGAPISLSQKTRLDEIARLYCVRDLCTELPDKLVLTLPVPGIRDRYWNAGNFSGADGYATHVCTQIAQDFERRVNLVLATGGEWKVSLDERSGAVRLTKMLNDSAEAPTDSQARRDSDQVMQAIGSLIGSHSYFGSFGERDSRGVGFELESFYARQLCGTAEREFERCDDAVRKSADRAIIAAGAHTVAFRAFVGDAPEGGYTFAPGYPGIKVGGSNGEYTVSSNEVRDRAIYLGALEARQVALNQLAGEMHEEILSLPWRLRSMDDRDLSLAMKLDPSVPLGEEQAKVLAKLQQLGAWRDPSEYIEDCGAAQLHAVLLEVHAKLFEPEFAKFRELNWCNNGYQMVADLPAAWQPSDDWMKQRIRDGRIEITPYDVSRHVAGDHPLIAMLLDRAASQPAELRRQKAAESQELLSKILALPWKVPSQWYVTLSPADLGQGFKDALRLIARYYEMSGLDCAFEYESVKDKIDPKATTPSYGDRPEYTFEASDLTGLSALGARELFVGLKSKIDLEIPRALDEIVALPWDQQADGSFILYKTAISKAQAERLVNFAPVGSFAKAKVITQGRYRDEVFLVSKANKDATLYDRLVANQAEREVIQGPPYQAPLSRI